MFAVHSSIPQVADRLICTGPGYQATDILMVWYILNWDSEKNSFVIYLSVFSVVISAHTHQRIGCQLLRMEFEEIIRRGISTVSARDSFVHL